MKKFLISCIAVLALSVTVHAAQTSVETLESAPGATLLSDAEMTQFQGTSGGLGSAMDLLEYLRSGTPRTGFYMNWVIEFFDIEIKIPVKPVVL